MAQGRKWLWAVLLACAWLASACNKTCLNPQPEPPGEDCESAAKGGTGGTRGGVRDAGAGGGVITVPDGGARSDAQSPGADATSDGSPPDVSHDVDVAEDTTEAGADGADAAEANADAIEESGDLPPNDVSADVEGGDAPPPSDLDAGEGGPD